MLPGVLMVSRGGWTVTKLPGELLFEMPVCVWHLAVTIIYFCPVLDQACEAVVEVENEDDVPSPQLKLYSTVWPKLEEEAPTVYE